MRAKITSFIVLLLAMGQIGTAQMARVQAIHNCADAAADTVDVWLNNTKLIDDFPFQGASPYIDAPAGVAFDLSICPKNSVDTSSAIFQKSFTLAMGTAYTVVASGGLGETGNTAFDLRAYSGMEMAANQSAGEVSVNIIHGSYDAPEVDIYEVQIPAGELVPDLEFGEDIGSYVDLGATDYNIQVRTQTGIVAAEFDVDLSAFEDSAITVLASGFLDPSMAAGTTPFGLIAVFPNGTVAPLPSKSVTPARLQVIHNCAATDAASVDVWLNDGPQPLLDNFDFRTASPFIDAPAGVNFDVSIALPTSMDTMGALFKQTFLLESGMTYIVVASGTVGSGMYSPATPFTLEVIPMAQEASMDTNEVDVMVWHGATDAPTVDVVETLVGAGTLVDDLGYGEFAGYLNLTPANYHIAIKDSTGMTTVGTFDADLSALAGNAITVLASGFLSPNDDNNGMPFGLFVALPTGGQLLELSTVTSIDETNELSDMRVFPNPISNNTQININSTIASEVDFRILSVDGAIVYTGKQNLSRGENQLNFSANLLARGTYYLHLDTGTNSRTIKLLKIE